MEVHHHAHPSPGIPRHAEKRWVHHLWEFFMLFLAVFCGFLAENWREHWVEKQRVKEYARSLIYDLRKDTSMINQITGRIRLNIRMTDSLSDYLKHRPLSGIRNIDLFVLSAIDRYPPYWWSRATLEQIKNSGSLRYFTNYEILDRISFYDAVTHHMDEDHQNDDELANQASETRARLVNMDYSKDLTMALRKDIDSTRKTPDMQALLRDDATPLLTNDINAIHYFLNEKVNMRKHLMIRVDEELPKLKKQAVELAELLKREYHIRGEIDETAAMRRF